MAVVGELVLLGARDLPALGHELGALTHRQAGARLDDRGQHRPEMFRPQPEPRRDARPGGAAAMAGEQQLLVGTRIDHRRVADRIGSAGDAGLDLPERDLVADADGGLEASAAGALQIKSGRLRVEPDRQHALARQVVVPGVLDDRARGYVPEPLALQLEALDHGAKRSREHLLVAGRGVGRVGAGEGNAYATDDGDAPGC